MGLAENTEGFILTDRFSDARLVPTGKNLNLIPRHRPSCG